MARLGGSLGLATVLVTSTSASTLTSQGENMTCSPVDSGSPAPESVNMTLMDCMETCRSAGVQSCHAITFTPPQSCIQWSHAVVPKASVGSSCFKHGVEPENEMSTLAAANPELQAQSSGSGWVKVPGGLKYVSTSRSWAWGVNSNDNIYKCRLPCYGAWQAVDGKLKQIDAGDQEVWGVNSADMIYKRSADGSGRWSNVPGRLKHVSVGARWVWGVNSADMIYRCAVPCSGGWIQVDGRLKQISVGTYEVWGVNSADAIYKRPVDGSGAWTPVGGSLKHVSVNGRLAWGVNKADQIYKCRLPCHWARWERIPGSLMQVDAGPWEAWGVNSQYSIYKRHISHERRLEASEADGASSDFKEEDSPGFFV